MQQSVRVDLIFPRSGQIVPVFVPNFMVNQVSKRNLEVLFTLNKKNAFPKKAQYA